MNFSGAKRIRESHGFTFFSFPAFTLGWEAGLEWLSVAPVGLISRSGVPNPPGRLHLGSFFMSACEIRPSACNPQPFWVRLLHQPMR